MSLQVAVLGAGTMGTGIAYVFLAATSDVTVVDPDPASLELMSRHIEEVAADGHARGRLTSDAAGTLTTRLRTVTEIGEVPPDLDLIVESVPEVFELKTRVLASAESRNPRLLATNTSSLSIDSLAGDLACPERFLGMHFFNPVWSLRLVEVVRGAATDQASLDHALSAVAMIGKEAAVVSDRPGFATSRLDLCASLEAIRMVQEGVGSPKEIDRAITLAYRHPVGPLELADIVGLDVRLDIARELESKLGARYAAPQLLVDMVADGHLGRKSGRGFYLWAGDRILHEAVTVAEEAAR